MNGGAAQTESLHLGVGAVGAVELENVNPAERFQFSQRMVVGTVCSVVRYPVMGPMSSVPPFWAKRGQPLQQWVIYRRR